MRILVVADGLEPLLEHTIGGLADRGHDVRLADTSGLSWTRRTRRFGLHLARGTRHNRSSLSAFARDLGAEPGLGLEAARRFSAALPLLSEPCDVVYFEAAYVAATFVGVLHRLPPKLVMCTGSDVRVMPDENRFLRASLPTAFAAMGRIVCRSVDLQEWAIRRGAPSERTAVLRPGVDLRAFAPDGRPLHAAPPLRLISVGRQHWVKGYEYAIQAVHLARERKCDIEYRLIGRDAGTGSAIDFAIRDLGLDEWVSRHGHRSVQGVKAALATSDVFVVSSVSEGICRAAQEAMAMGLPVISTDVGGMPDVITDGIEGLLVPARDPEAMCEAIVRLAEHPEQRMVMGERAAARAQSFDAERHLDQLETTLRELASFSSTR